MLSSFPTDVVVAMAIEIVAFSKNGTIFLVRKVRTAEWNKIKLGNIFKIRNDKLPLAPCGTWLIIKKSNFSYGLAVFNNIMWE